MTMPTPIKTHRASGPDDNAPHILIVDDDSRIRDLLARYLHDHGFRVSTAVDAASARACMRSLSFDLLILDVMMPQESGIDFARSLRSSSQVPILMLTARAEPARAVAQGEQRAPPRGRRARLGRGAHGRVRVPHLARRAEA
jgi:two-component system, OmpR family, phosphate regulon response regulator OmpR